MANHRKLDHDMVLNLLADGVRQVDIARRIGAKVAQVNGVVERARKKGDPRAMKERAAAHKPPVTRAATRTDVVVINVPCTKHTTDGTPRSAPVSLPRLSILSGWTGRA